MKALNWKIDENNQVQVNQGLFGKQRVLLNDVEVASKILFGKATIPFVLIDGRKAELSIIPSGFVPERELRVEGQVILSEMDLRHISCLKCSNKVKPGDKYCEKCGAELPSAENQLKIKKLKEARNTIAVVAGMFLVFGIAMFFFQNGISAKSLQNLAQFRDTDFYPQLIAGKQYTVGELRQNLQRQPWNLLVTNLVLAALMFGLYQYAKKSPLVAIMSATGIYVAVQVLNAILYPPSLSQGLVMKVIVISILIKGVRSTLELRKISA